MSYQPIGSEQCIFITNEIEKFNLINKSDENEYQLYLAKLSSDCVICYSIMESLAQTNLDIATRFEQWKLYQNSKTALSQNQQTQNEIIKTRQAVWLNGGTGSVSGIAWFVFILKWIFKLLLAPVTLLFWALSDPYIQLFCQNHFELRPIQKERTRRLIIYGIATVCWIGVVAGILANNF